MAVLWIMSVLIFERVTEESNPDATVCVLRNTVGIPCPTCRGTRAVFALGHGDLCAALTYNPLVIVAGIVMGTLLLIRVCFGRAVRIRRGAHRRAFWSAVLVAVVLNWAYVIWHELNLLV